MAPVVRKKIRFPTFVEQKVKEAADVSHFLGLLYRDISRLNFR